MTSHHFHAVVWIDHHEARVFHFSPTEVEKLVLHPDHPTRHIHHKANSIGSGHAAEDHAFLHAVAQSFADAGAVLITGPANAKTELVKHISRARPGVDEEHRRHRDRRSSERCPTRRSRPALLQGRGSDAAAEGLTHRIPDFSQAPHRAKSAASCLPRQVCRAPAFTDRSRMRTHSPSRGPFHAVVIVPVIRRGF